MPVSLAAASEGSEEGEAMERETGECVMMAAAAAAAAAGEMYLLTAGGGGGGGSVATAASAAASRAMGRKGRKMPNRIREWERGFVGREYMEREFMGRVEKRGLRVKVEERERKEGLVRLEAQHAENDKVMEGTVPGGKLLDFTTRRNLSSEDEQGVPDFDAGFDYLDLSRW